MNKYLEPITMKKRHGFNFKARSAKRKLFKYIDSISPGFADMWEISNFLGYLRYCYMYDNNNDKFHLFIGTLPKNSKNMRAIVYKESGFTIKYVLKHNPSDASFNEIGIEITRNGHSMQETEQFQFYDGEYEFKDEYDEIKMQFITACLMNGVKELIRYYYDNKKF